MNHLIKLTLKVCLLALFLPFNSIAQNNSFQTDHSINLTGSSKTETVTLNIDKETASLRLNIRSKVQLGSLKIEIYDPNGELRGNFEIEGGTGSNPESSETVEGRISKLIETPEQGAWLIKIVPLGAHGQILIKSNQLLN